jgi:hypothetical protein
MAQLVLSDIRPAILVELERRARQAGTSVQAEALRLLEAVLGGVVASRPEDAEAPVRTLADLQADLCARYPDEYVVLRGDQMLLHTADKQEAFACEEEALERGDEDVFVVPPGEARRHPMPVFRGRAFAGGRRP